MGEILVCTVTVKGWPWKKPKTWMVTDAYGGTWTHLETRFNWWKFQWIGIFQQCFQSDASAKHE